MMTIGLIALDLDGTLLDSQKNLSERNRRALERCARMGIQIVPTTGRAVDGITQAVRFLPGGPVISTFGCAGGQLRHNHQRRNGGRPY